MRLKLITSGLVVMCLLAMLNIAGAQGPSAEWDAWNAQITAYADSSQLDIAETQIITVTKGPLHGGERNYSQPVEIQSVYVAMNGGQPQELSEGNGPGTFQISNSSGDVVLDYELPDVTDTGDQFAVQINYSVEAASAGLIDWFVVPGDHPFPVNSSTVTLNFPDGQVPSADFVRLAQGNGTVSVSGNSIIIQSQGTIPANQSFEIQVPYGAGVGEPGNSGSSGNQNPVQTAPTGGTGTDSGGLGSILPILCILAVVVLLGGRNMLGGLLGGLGGSRGGGFFGGSSGNQPSSPFGGNPSSGRGFRESSNQNRDLPPVQGDKRSGGGARFK